jgi:hypothetical protein
LQETSTNKRIKNKMSGRPLELPELLRKFRETLFTIASKEPANADNEKGILRYLLNQNKHGVKKELLNQELKRDELYRSTCSKPKLQL